MTEHIPFIRIFVSSPGDVNDERRIALDVIEQLPYRPTFRERVAFRVIAWDKPGAGTPMRATLTPQDAINRGLPTPAECDIVIVIFWSRMGTPFTDRDGREYQSGTHWELLNALGSKRAETVIYRRTDDPPFKISDPDFDQKHAQYKTVKAFFESDLFYDTDGRIRRGINMYRTPDDFRRAFEIDLEVLVLDILRRIEGGSPSAGPVPAGDDDNISTIRAVDWPPDRSPFPGLRAFTETDAPIFFGRGYETDALVRQMADSRFVAVVGASGSGKSSLVGAGLIPRLRANAIPGSKDWRVVCFTPGDSPFINMADALVREMPALRLAEILRAREALPELIEAALADAPDWVEVLLFIDQSEELFTLASKADAEAVAAMLATCAHSRRLRAVVTMRADFYHRAVEYPPLAELLRAGSFPLAIPKRDALRQMIERPAGRASLTFDHALVDRMLDDTGDEPGNLALMAYTLDELYKLDDDRLLTHGEYDRLGGVQGAIGTRAENTFSGLAVDNGVLQQVFHALVEVDERGTATRRRAQLQPESLPDDVHRLIAAFTDARLLTTSFDEKRSTATVEVAHEAILRSWPRLAGWIEDTQDDLRLLRQVRNAAEEWHAKGSPDYLLWPQERLKLVYAMIERLHPELSEVERDFIEPEQYRLYRELGFGVHPVEGGLVDVIPAAQIAATTHQRRYAIGMRLHDIGDIRRGVGVINGLPDILWLPVAGSNGLYTFEFGEFEVKLFFIAKYLVTVPQLQVFLDSDWDNPLWWDGFPSEYRPQTFRNVTNGRANAPRDTISWYQAVAFARWLNHRLRGFELSYAGTTPASSAVKTDKASLVPTGFVVGENAEIRLPTEWEWQWAAMAGAEERAYPWGGWDDHPRANTTEAGIQARSTAVGMYPHGAAACGALDMAGNLWEWCANNKSNPEIIDAANTGLEVLRGGSTSF